VPTTTAGQRGPSATVLLGTRPEAIKLAPLVRVLRATGARVRVVASGQHRELVNNLLPALGITVDADFEAMREAQSLPGLTNRILDAVTDELTGHRPEVLVVQGDTTTAMAGALAAFYARIPVAHVEAGLRSRGLAEPFPEEANRQLVARLARWHFAPTTGARDALLAEGIDRSAIEVTGNTVIDNLLWVRDRGLGTAAFDDVPGPRRRRVLLTLHRRENHGPAMAGLAAAVGRLATRYNLDVVFPVHPNPAVRASVLPALAAHPRVRLVDPLPYLDFTATLAAADLVLTDSGGVQEEAPTLGKPVLVLRNTTERPEAIAAGCARLVGTDPAELEAAAAAVLTDERLYRRMSAPASPFGDGRAAARIADRLSRDLSRNLSRAAPLDGVPLCTSI
jgi:UDP-N-acetylglucosamine 2-epimerase (non-hydrolysing)